MVLEQAGKMHLFEIKSTMTITPKHITSLKRMKQELGPQIKSAAIISCADDNFVIKKDIANYSWKSVLSM